jgi:hypothetical protein
MPTQKMSANAALMAAKLVTTIILARFAKLRFLKLMTHRNAWLILVRQDISKKA